MNENERAEDFGFRLAKLLEAKNWSERELARRLQISAKTVEEWIGRGGRMPRSAANLNKLSDLFEVTLDYLILGRVPPREPRKERFPGHGWDLYEIYMRRIGGTPENQD